MNRWRREFREWARREGLHVWTMPHDPKDWDTAKACSQLVNSMAPDVEKKIEDALLYGIFP